MSSVSMVGVLFITLALVFYGIASISLQQFKQVTKCVLWFLHAGVLFEIAAIIFMMAGAERYLFTFHNILGLFALLAMVLNLVWVVKVYRSNGEDAPIGKQLYWYTLFAYAFWIAAYLLGLILVILK